MGEAEIYASITSTVNTHVNKLIKNNTYYIFKTLKRKTFKICIVVREIKILFNLVKLSILF